VILSDLSPTREIYETIETADHEYEVLDMYHQATYEEIIIKPDTADTVQLQPLAITGDYDFTQCPAYVPMATTSIHGNTNKLNKLAAAETPSTQPTATNYQNDS
jgi:hypothetical protein